MQKLKDILTAIWSSKIGKVAVYLLVGILIFGVGGIVGHCNQKKKTDQVKFEVEQYQMIIESYQKKKCK